jgi:Poly A polymerase head domain
MQDALRRDLTINALFYNLDTGAVEDFSGRGLDDLRAGVVRTPLAPRETFMDGEQQLVSLPFPALVVSLLQYELQSWPMHHTYCLLGLTFCCWQTQLALPLFIGHPAQIKV